jgi:TPR repeat protein
MTPELHRKVEGNVMRLIFAVAFAMALSCAWATQSLAQDDEDAADAASTAFNNGDYEGALKIWQPKADAGDPDAMTNIGVLYQYGLGIPRSMKKAAEMYEKAAQLGFVTAQYDLANLYYDGNGVDRDRKQAARWYTAAAQGGHAKSQFYLAQMYESGVGVEENQATALQWYMKASDQELPEAQYTLGNKLINGTNVDADPAKGSDLVLKAAEQKYVLAQILMGQLYWRGKVLPQNLIEGYVWASQAKDNAKVPRDKKRADDLYDAIKSNMTAEQVKAAEIELVAVAPKKKKKDAAGKAGSSDDSQE